MAAVLREMMEGATQVTALAFLAVHRIQHHVVLLCLSLTQIYYIYIYHTSLYTKKQIQHEGSVRCLHNLLRTSEGDRGLQVIMLSRHESPLQCQPHCGAAGMGL